MSEVLFKLNLNSSATFKLVPMVKCPKRHIFNNDWSKRSQPACQLCFKMTNGTKDIVKSALSLLLHIYGETMFHAYPLG